MDMQSSIAKQASDKAHLVTKYVAVFFGNFCAISAIYFTIRTKFLMPESLQVFGMAFAAWVVVILIVHTVLRPYLEKRFLRKMAANQN